MKTFKEYINEGVTSPDRMEALKEVLQYCYANSKEQTIWRGFNSKVGGLVLDVTADTAAYRGKIDDLIRTIIETLGIKSPTFVTLKGFNAKFFGTPMVFIPVGSYTSFSNPKLDDLTRAADVYNLDKPAKGGGKYPFGLNATKEEKVAAGKMVAKDYVKKKNGIVTGNKYEIIIDIQKYRLVSVGQMITMNKSKFNPIKKVDDLVTYGDLAKLIESFIKYEEWRNKNK